MNLSISRYVRYVATLATVLLNVCSFTWYTNPARAEPGHVQVARWKNNADAAASVTMDDSYANQWRYMAPLLASRGFFGTFFVITQYIDDENLWGPWKDVAAAGHEIASHTANHYALTEVATTIVNQELALSKQRIVAEIGPEHGKTFAFPYSKSSVALATKVEAAGYVAARTGGSAYAGATPENNYLINSLHPLTDTPLSEINGWIDTAITEKQWLVVGVHGIVDFSHRYGANQEGWEPVPLERYVAMVDHMAVAVAKNQLWVATMLAAYQYIAARDAAQAQTLSNTHNHIQIYISSKTNNKTAVTWVVAVPSSWMEVNVKTSGDFDMTKATTATNAGFRQLVFDAAPPATFTITPTAIRGQAPNLPQDSGIFKRDAATTIIDTTPSATDGSGYVLKPCEQNSAGNGSGCQLSNLSNTPDDVATVLILIALLCWSTRQCYSSISKPARRMP